MFDRRLSVQRRLLMEFTSAFCEQRPLPVRYPLVSRRLLGALGDVPLPLGLLERQISAWFHSLYARPPRRVVFGEGPRSLLVILHNLLWLCHPAAREMGSLYQLCRRRTEGLIANLPPAKDREAVALYHALLQRFEPFLPQAMQQFEVQLGLERTVSKSPLTTLLWMENLSKVQFDSLKPLVKDRELGRFVLLTVVDKERTIPERHLPRIRELIRTLEKFEEAGLTIETGLARELEALRQAFTDRRATAL